MSNIDDFNRVIGIVFSKLYDNFPVPLDIHSSHIILDIFGPEKDGISISKDDQGEFDFMMTDETTASRAKAFEMTRVAQNYDTIFTSSMCWLSVEGFVRYSDELPDIYSNAVLTEKGLKALSLIPAGLEASIGESLVQTVKSGARDGLGKIAKQAICEWGPTVLGNIALGIMKP